MPHFSPLYWLGLVFWVWFVYTLIVSYLWWEIYAVFPTIKSRVWVKRSFPW